jgi:hypothetical protein
MRHGCQFMVKREPESWLLLAGQSSARFGSYQELEAFVWQKLQQAEMESYIAES